VGRLAALVGLGCLAATALLPQGMGSPVKAVARPSPAARSEVPAPPIDYRDIAPSLGLTAPNVYGGESKKRYILEMTGNGVAVVDYDNDGSPDLFFVDGTRLDGKPAAGNRLYRNSGDGRFTDVTAAAGLARSGWGQGVCAADYDNDGHTDLLVTYYGYNVLYRNLGSGKFEDATRQSGLPLTGDRWATGCAFLDYDRDGFVDLFLSNYLGFELAKAQAPGSSPFCLWKGVSVFCGPKGFPGGQNILYRNERNGRFRDVSKQAGVALPGLHYGLGVVASDFDNDGWPDLYVACDSTPGILYANNRDGTFRDIAVEAGAAYGDAGQEQGSMGVAAADYDRDGLMDIVKTNFMDETPTLYHNDGDRFFTDATYAAGLGIHTKFVGWGVEFLDVDHDGRKDILMANGHIYPEVDGGGSGERFRLPKLLYWNLGNGAFRDVTAAAGPALAQPAASRGMASGDLDGDGDLETVVVNMNAPPAVLKNVLKNAAAKGNAILVELEGTKSNRRAIGARVTVDGQTAEVRSGGSYASQADFRLHFGLGSAAVVDRVAVRWPSGLEQTFTGVPANHVLTIREGDREIRRKAFRRR